MSSPAGESVCSPRYVTLEENAVGDKGIKPVLCNMLPQVKYIPRGGTKQSAQLHFLLITTLSYRSGVSPHPKQTTTARCRVKNSPWRKESPSRPSRLHYSQYMSLAPVLKLLIKAAHSGPRMGIPHGFMVLSHHEIETCQWHDNHPGWFDSIIAGSHSVYRQIT